MHLQLPTDGEDTKLSQSFDYSHTMTKKDYRKWHVELVSMITDLHGLSLQVIHFWLCSNFQVQLKAGPTQ